ncbi:MAG: PfkB family carbohydrate kinase, partial [Planctomycetia bacterium]|nr:PfkB family carbohydrate kinase [Planctomycetia bacterium]
MANQYRIFVFGEVLWDMLPGGKKLGGAPANFAYHVRLRGGDAMVCSKVGNDELGAEIKSRFATAGLPLDFLQTDATSPTGTVQVHLSSLGQPSYQIVENVAWDRIEAQDSAINWVSGADAVYFGSLALRGKANRNSLDRILSAAPDKAMKVFDLNLRAPFYSRNLIEAMLEQTNVFKFHDDELVTLADMFRDRL